MNRTSHSVNIYICIYPYLVFQGVKSYEAAAATTKPSDMPAMTIAAERRAFDVLAKANKVEYLLIFFLQLSNL